jgi:hypothetical protein
MTRALQEVRQGTVRRTLRAAAATNPHDGGDGRDAERDGADLSPLEWPLSCGGGRWVAGSTDRPALGPCGAGRRGAARAIVRHFSPHHLFNSPLSHRFSSTTVAPLIFSTRLHGWLLSSGSHYVVHARHHIHIGAEAPSLEDFDCCISSKI